MSNDTQPPAYQMTPQEKKWRGDKQTMLVIEERVSQVVAELSNNPSIHKVELRRKFAPLWKVHNRTVDRMVSRARDELFLRLKRSKEDFRMESLSFYESVINSASASYRDKIKARHRIDDLLGLDAPRSTVNKFQLETQPAPMKSANGIEGIDLASLPPDKFARLKAALAECMAPQLAEKKDA